MSLPLTPGSGSSRAGKISVTIASSASVSARPNSRCRYRVRENRCGWKTAMTRSWPPFMAAVRVAAISVGWWA